MKREGVAEGPTEAGGEKVEEVESRRRLEVAGTGVEA